MEAPEKIWAIPECPKWGVMQGVWDDEQDGQPGEVEYTRSDYAATAVREAEQRGWNEAIEAAANIVERQGHSLCVEIRHLKKGQTDG